MSTKARFQIHSVTETIGSKPTGKKNDRGYDEYEPAPMFSIKANPVYGNGDPEHPNTKFWQASPSGVFELGTVNAAAVEGWKPGTILEFTIDIVPEGK